MTKRHDHSDSATASRSRAHPEDPVTKPRVITITVSDTRTEKDDTSGKALREELAAFEHVRHAIVPDDPERIAALIKDAVARGEADAYVLTGGTGIAPRDRTYEALSSSFDKELTGFGEAFRRLSWDEIGPRSILSRATAGTIGTSLVFLLPGSEKAARLGARALIAPILEHAVDLANGRTKHR
jgi:molybdenum cofactor biosynthesis protein B